MFAIIDLETTGSKASEGKITEVAIIVHDGKKTIKEFSSLVNPECYIPPFITSITGIDNSMVADAPKFYEIAKEIVELTENCVFVAHNVSFDYHFLREEFKRLGFDYQRKKLCTVKLSRKYLPGFRSYSLGRLCESLGIPIFNRHRALGDAKATALLFEKIIGVNESLMYYGTDNADLFKGFPSHLDRAQLRRMPEEPGIWKFFDGEGRLLLAGAGRNILAGVIKQFSSLSRGRKAVRPWDVHDIDWEMTGNELMAKLKYAELMLEEQPLEQQNLQIPKFKYTIAYYPDQQNILHFYPEKISKVKSAIGLFTTEDEARSSLALRARFSGICGKLLVGESDCQVENCPVCSREVNSAVNDAHLDAIRGLGYPYRDFLLLGEGRMTNEINVIAVKNGIPKGWGYFDKENGWSYPGEVLEMLTEIVNTELCDHVLRASIDKIPHDKIVRI